MVIGLVGALGTNLGQVEGDLQQALGAVGYRCSKIRLSTQIADIYPQWRPNPASSDDSSMSALMRQGDEFRDAAGPNAVVAIGISRLMADRLAETQNGEERQGHATILRSLKRKEEVATLREVYGPRFLLIGGWATREERRAAIKERLSSEHSGRDVGWYEQQTASLMARDEDDETLPYGQGVRDTFELADYYVALRSGYPTAERITRLVRLLFGSPFETPTHHEQAMFTASGAGMRSCARRQVGVVVTDADGEILVTGTNEAPKAGGGQYWPGDSPDHRDFNYGYDVNDRLKLHVVADALARLRSADWLSGPAAPGDPDKLAAEALQGPLRDSRVANLLEFGRIAHAEMAAICTAARRGTALRAATMYTTTYPCHECARLIIAAGIVKVVYVDPYPKSQVQEMFKDEVSEGSSLPTPGAVMFEPFEGVAPRLFRSLFLAPPRRRDRVTGVYETWEPTASPLRVLNGLPAPNPVKPLEDSVIAELNRRLSGAAAG